MADQKYLRPDFDFCLAHVVEECGEVLAAAGKTQRWGRCSANPELPADQQETNEVWLRRELGDLKGAIDRLLQVMPQVPEEGETGADDFLIRKLLSMSVTARIADKAEEADTLAEAAETLGQLARGR